MRSLSKIVSAFAAIVMTVALVGFVGTPAQAAKPKHDMTSVRGYETAKGQFFATGKISTLKNKNVILQKGPKKGPYLSLIHI